MWATSEISDSPKNDNFAGSSKWRCWTVEEAASGALRQSIVLIAFLEEHVFN